MLTPQTSKPLIFLAALFAIFYFTQVSISYAASASEIDIKVDEALKRFQTEVSGGDRFLEKASGVLVFPDVIKAGFGIGGE